MRHAAIALALLALACGGDSPAEPSIDTVLLRSELTIISGDLQQDTVRAILGDPLVVQLTDSAGAPVEGALVNFHAQEACARPFAGSSLTDADGKAAERWQFAGQAGECVVEARAVDSDGTPRVLSSTTFTAVPGAITVNEYAETGSFAGEDPLRMRGEYLTDQYGNAIPTSATFDSLARMRADTIYADSVGWEAGFLVIEDSVTTIPLVLYNQGPTDSYSWKVEVCVGEWAQIGHEMCAAGS